MPTCPIFTGPVTFYSGGLGVAEAEGLFVLPSAVYPSHLFVINIVFTYTVPIQEQRLHPYTKVLLLKYTELKFLAIKQFSQISYHVATIIQQL